MAVVYRKTPKGVAEIGTRAFRLPPRLRGALILVDGRKTDAELAALILAEPQASLDALLADGFIEVAATLADRPAERRSSPASTATESAAPRGGATFEATRRDAVRQLNDQLGPSAETLAIKMERTTALRELQPLLAQAVALLRSARGAAAAEAFAARFVVDAGD